MSTKADNILDRDSCWNKAKIDEPVFVLKATDDIASATVIMWCANYLRSKGGWEQMSMVQRAKYNEALACAAAMNAHRLKHFDDDIPF